MLERSSIVNNKNEVTETMKKRLTNGKKRPTIRRMRAETQPVQEHQSNRPAGRRAPPAEVLYTTFFVPAPSPFWRNDEENFSLEQPSPFKWVPSETTYGIGPVPNLEPHA
jgi:hypothetical protein